MTTPATKQATIQRLRIQNYRVLRDVRFSDLTPLTVLLGPNGSGKSTVFDVFAFLHEAFTTSLRAAWDHRNRIRELRSRGENGPMVTYRLRLDEENGSPVVVGELLRWSTAPGAGAPRDILSFQRGEGRLYDDASKVSTDEQLDSPDLLAVSTLGGLARHPRVAHLRRFISGWYLSYLNRVLADEARQAAGRSQLLVTTHSPYFVDALRPRELWVLYRDAEGFTRTVRASDMKQVVAQTYAGGLLGNLWMEGYFDAGDPLVRGGRPRARVGA